MDTGWLLLAFAILWPVIVIWFGQPWQPPRKLHDFFRRR